MTAHNNPRRLLSTGYDFTIMLGAMSFDKREMSFHESVDAILPSDDYLFNLKFRFR